MQRLVTPRAVLAEIKAAKDKPWWATKLFDDITRHLAISLFKGKPLLDTPMTHAACEAVIMEAIDIVQKPASLDQLMIELRALKAGHA